MQAGLNRMVGTMREREQLRDLFGRHVGEDVARLALRDGVALGGEEREAAALFVDVIGSTTFAATRSPAEVVTALNRFFEVVVDVVATHGGLVNKFEGDAALCIFGAPLELPDPAANALRAAREMAERLKKEVPDLDAGDRRLAGPGDRRQHRRHPAAGVHRHRRPGERGGAADRAGQGASRPGRGVAADRRSRRDQASGTGGSCSSPCCCAVGSNRRHSPCRARRSSAAEEVARAGREAGDAALATGWGATGGAAPRHRRRRRTTSGSGRGRRSGWPCRCSARRGHGLRRGRLG